MKEVDQEESAVRRTHEAPGLLLAIALFRERELGASQRLGLLFTRCDVPHLRLATAVGGEKGLVIGELHLCDVITAQAGSTGTGRQQQQEGPCFCTTFFTQFCSNLRTRCIYLRL